MKNILTLLPVLAFGLLFTLLFYNQQIGINLLLFEVALLGWLCYKREIDWQSQNCQLHLTAVVLSGVSTVLVYSALAICINMIAFFVFVGALLYPKAKSIVTIMSLANSNLWLSQRSFFLTAVQNMGWQPSKSWRSVRLFVMPGVVILGFVVLYRSSNTVFDRLVGSGMDFVQSYANLFFESLDLWMVFTFVFGVTISSFVLYRTRNNAKIEKDAAASDALLRRKTQFISKSMLGLKNELRAGVFLLVILNMLLLVVNALDVYSVWLHFTWNGDSLKQFVHEGTYLLLLSIVSSMAIVLYFFRANLNFYQNNQFIRRLSYVWLLQNAFLTLSVGMRNWHYINYFALAYKRIALLFFLLLTLYGLYTIAFKVQQKRSTFYLFRKNTLACYVVLVVAATINWDQIIVNYNFSHAGKSYLELAYMAHFPDKTLPELQAKNLNRVKKEQQTKFPLASQDWEVTEYENHIKTRIATFKQDWETRSWQSWNYPEYRAYQQLTAVKTN